jgi:hypothetical protein
MRKVKLNTGSNLIEISQNIISGKTKEYIDFESESIEHKDYIISLAYLLNEYGFDFVGIESKYSFGKRNKRFEIILKDKSQIVIIKISKQNKFDKDALELDNIITYINSSHNIDLKGYILILDNFNKDIINDYIKSMKNNIVITSLFKFREKYVIFN